MHMSCMHTFTHIQTHTHSSTHIHTYIHMHTHTHVITNLTHTCVYTHIVHIWMCIHAHMCVYRYTNSTQIYTPNHTHIYVITDLTHMCVMCVCVHTQAHPMHTLIYTHINTHISHTQTSISFIRWKILIILSQCFHKSSWKPSTQNIKASWVISKPMPVWPPPVMREMDASSKDSTCLDSTLFLRHSLSEAGSHWDCTMLTSQQVPSIPLPPPSQHWSHRQAPASFSMGAGIWTHACAMSTLPTHHPLIPSPCLEGRKHKQEKL